MNMKTIENSAINHNIVNYQIYQHQTRKFYESTTQSQTQSSTTSTILTLLERCRKNTADPNIIDNFHAYLHRYLSIYFYTNFLNIWPMNIYIFGYKTDTVYSIYIISFKHSSLLSLSFLPLSFCFCLSLCLYFHLYFLHLIRPNIAITNTIYTIFTDPL